MVFDVELMAFTFSLTHGVQRRLLVRVLIADICTFRLAALPLVSLLQLLELLNVELVHFILSESITIYDADKS